ncbi:uncharacterized protein LOC133335918, partial [Musca vetustissima]|uniref:uncharacterized protein LOC133335918 n=1 Tax=Musca vetustissima TaxID=27455 RepID=UPI002AB70ACF
MNSSHLISNPQLGNHHPHHHHQQQHHHYLHNHTQQQQQQQPQPQQQSYTSKMPATTNNNINNQISHNYNNNNHEQQQHHTGLVNSRGNTQTSNTTTNQTCMTTQQQTMSSSSNPTSGSPTTNTTTTQATQQNNKFAPARRLAARHTLRLAIPKQQGDLSYANNTVGGGGISQFRHSSPSQLPPAPILKRNTTGASTTPQVMSHVPSPASVSSNTYSQIPKSASPLESNNLPNANSCTVSTATPSTANSGQFLRVRNPSITLNSTDLCNTNNNDFFAFAKDMSSPAVGDHSPIFAEIASSMSPSTSSASPSNHLNRLFNLSPSTLRSYGNMSDFSDSSQSGVISPASSFIENFHKKNGTVTVVGGGPGGGASSTSSSVTTSPSISIPSTIGGSTSPSINGGGIGGGNQIALAGGGSGSASRQINASSSSSVKETSSTSSSQQ